jgi:DNA-binding NarL/FixJ family response regulator
MTEYPPTKVLLADDHTMFREGLARLLATYGGLEVVGETANGQETRPDVVIMQVQMPFEKAQEALRRMREDTPTPKVVIVTMFEDPRMMRELLKLGASAYVLKSSSSRQLIGAVRAAVFDPLSNNVVVGMPLEALEEAQEGSGGVLTARQLEILLLAARGLSSREMAARLHIAQGTVSRHLSDVYKKLGVRSRSEATRKALREEWITITDITQESES